MRRLFKAAWISVGSALALAGLVAVAGLPLYVFPPAAAVSDADLIYVIGPPTAARVALAEELAEQGVASDFLVSVSAQGRYNTASAVDLCDLPEAVCDTPDPFTTKGEARMLRDYAAAHETGSTVVITFTPHVARTRYIFEKCYDGEVTVVGVDQRMNLGDWVYQYAYQSAAFVRAWLTPC